MRELRQHQISLHADSFLGSWNVSSLRDEPLLLHPPSLRLRAVRLDLHPHLTSQKEISWTPSPLKGCSPVCVKELAQSFIPAGPGCLKSLYSMFQYLIEGFYHSILLPFVPLWIRGAFTFSLVPTELLHTQHYNTTSRRLPMLCMLEFSWEEREGKITSYP